MYYWETDKGRFVPIFSFWFWLMGGRSALQKAPPCSWTRPIEPPGSFWEGCEAGSEECCKALLQLGGDEQLLLNRWTVGLALLLIRDLSEPVKLQSSAARQLHSWVGVVVDSRQKLICRFSKTGGKWQLLQFNILKLISVEIDQGVLRDFWRKRFLYRTGRLWSTGKLTSWNSAFAAVWQMLLLFNSELFGLLISLRSVCMQVVCDSAKCDSCWEIWVDACWYQSVLRDFCRKCFYLKQEWKIMIRGKLTSWNQASTAE